MISRDMYRLLKRFPNWPHNKAFEKIGIFPLMDKYHRLGLVMEAKSRGLIECNGREEDSSAGFYLTEAGRQTIEEYKRQTRADINATWALIIAILSLIASVVSIFLSQYVQQA